MFYLGINVHAVAYFFFSFRDAAATFTGRAFLLAIVVVRADLFLVLYLLLVLYLFLVLYSYSGIYVAASVGCEVLIAWSHASPGSRV